MMYSLTRQAFALTLHSPVLWLLSLLAGETGLAVILFPPQTLTAPGLSLPMPHLAPLLLLLLTLGLLVLWLLSALALAALVLTIARLSRSQPSVSPWLGALPYFWPLLALRFTYLVLLAFALFLLAFFASLPLAWLAAILLVALAGLLLNLATRALLLDPHPVFAFRSLFARHPWPLFKVWAGSQLLSLLVLFCFLLLVLFLEIFALVLFYLVGTHLPDPYFQLSLLVTGLLIALPLLAFVALAGTFMNSYWTLAYLRLRAL